MNQMPHVYTGVRKTTHDRLTEHSSKRPKVLVTECNRGYMQTLEPSRTIPTRPAVLLQGVPTARRPSVDGLSLNDPRWQLTLRIAASSSLGRSRLMSDFLLYVVDRHIRDRGDEITEQQIGVLVFGRPEGYDSNEDNIVRSYARNLRKRIDEYFTIEGAQESLRLEIPRGGYTPVFLEVEPTLESQDNEDSSSVEPEPFEEAVLAATDPTPPKKPGTGLRRYLVPIALCLGVAMGASATTLVPRNLFKHAFMSSSQMASDRLWRQLFGKDRDTFIVPSDDGLVIMQHLTVRPVPLHSYVDGTYRTNVKTDSIPGAPEILKLGGRRYTSIADLDFVAQLSGIDEVVPERMRVRYARDLRMDDLRNGNAILIGSIEANPWIELFQPQMNFRFSINPGTDKPSGILNVHPAPGEQPIYGTPGPDHTYGLIAYVPNLETTGHVLIVGGLNTAGTEAAARFLLTPSLMMPTLQRAKDGRGGYQPFELLIGAGNVAANASTPQLILERVGQPQ
jgi:hypothetical protein